MKTKTIYAIFGSDPVREFDDYGITDDLIEYLSSTGGELIELDPNDAKNAIIKYDGYGAYSFITEEEYLKIKSLLK